MKVLVTGASGFLGGHVAELLARRGDTVRALVRSTSNRRHLERLPNLEFYEGAVEDVDRVREAVDGVDAVVHAAGLVKARSTDEFFAINVGGTSNLIQAARSHGHTARRFVFVSTLVACGPSLDGLPIPGDQESPDNAYGRSKLAAEKVVLSARNDLHVVILRPGAIYGPRDGEIFEVFKSIQRGLLPLVADGLAKGSWVYATDCAEACLRAIDADVPSGSVYFVDDGCGPVDAEAALRRRREGDGPPGVRSPEPPGRRPHDGRARHRGVRPADQPTRHAHAREGEHALAALGLLIRRHEARARLGAKSALERRCGPRGHLVPRQRLALERFSLALIGAV